MAQMAFDKNFSRTVGKYLSDKAKDCEREEPAFSQELLDVGQSDLTQPNALVWSALGKIKKRLESLKPRLQAAGIKLSKEEELLIDGEIGKLTRWQNKYKSP